MTFRYKLKMLRKEKKEREIERKCKSESVRKKE